MLVIFDTETTGLKGDVVEFGSVILTDSGRRFQFNERCKPNAPISERAFQVHGISDADVENCRPSSTVVSEWLSDVDNLSMQIHEEIVFCAHNLAFDYGIISQHVDISGYKRFCSLKTARAEYKHLDSRQLGDLYRFFGFSTILQAHSALDDCTMLESILPRLVPNYYEEAVKQMEQERLKAAEPPKFLKTVNFGKRNRGKLFTDVSRDDLIWMYENMTNNKDVVYTAGVLLGKEQR